ncbi:heavy metal translocating P-type ATPase [Fluviicola taffensis]|uniref:Copper-exporting ATPase n=1 Tax=Fluviicola taffensis (strain DSM 16823 / NCIMB 13979 / RW262) TaxID=755732 RepID=F2IKH9_FLUTR|nr:heavy metal translocating P-type ATPase metal-binding domain-containing protein [Fluviicola taffensis]AEA45105.1 Copper-exporting ATPase [Fluviicola taffensis DSM 16823]
MENQTENNTCYHCHDSLSPTIFYADDHSFCCNGCKQVYQLLSSHSLGAYYEQDANAGIRPNKTAEETFAVLDDLEIRKKYIDFQEGSTVKLTLHLPQIHCASCIYLLEHLHKLNEGILSSSVHFPKKTATITVTTELIKLSELARLLTKIGYEPNFKAIDKSASTFDKRLLLQLGVAGFAFGSIMLWSFPEYLGIDQTYSGIREFSSYLSFAVSIPVLLFSARDYFKSAIAGMRLRNLNLDIPIAIGILALYIRSCVAIFSQEGPGYMDSFAAFIFFLLIGKWFQGKTYQWLSFERDFRAYFPVAVIKKTSSDSVLCPIDKLQVGDEISIRNEEIIPCDCILLTEKATVDYSFVSGEADWIEKKKGDLLYAGGKNFGETIQLVVSKTTERSTLTQLWNDRHTKRTELSFQTRQDRISKYFIAAVLILAIVSSIVWIWIDPRQIPEVVTAILIVACPCALALSVPFVYGNMLRVLGKNGFYLRNTAIIERIQQCNYLVFDKTGTLTEQDHKQIEYTGRTLSEFEKLALHEMTKHAIHPYARAIHDYFSLTIQQSDATISPIEIPGRGISFGFFQLGSASFLGLEEQYPNESVVYFAAEGKLLGTFLFHSKLRNQLKELVQNLGSTYQLAVISGDKPKDLELLKQLFPVGTSFHFEQQPLQKKEFIQDLQAKGNYTLMIGDGLNDAGALNEAFVGIALSENLVRFTPASDAILKAENLNKLAAYFQFIRDGKRFLRICFAFSLCYNLTGIGFAVTGQLTPFVATILMPLSSITVVSLATFLTIRRKFNDV